MIFCNKIIKKNNVIPYIMHFEIELKVDGYEETPSIILFSIYLSVEPPTILSLVVFYHRLKKDELKRNQ